jgi:hypothetical protein
MDTVDRELQLQEQIEEINKTIELLLSLSNLNVSDESYIGTLEELYFHRAKLGFKLMRLRFRKNKNTK